MNRGQAAANMSANSDEKSGDSQASASYTIA